MPFHRYTLRQLDAFSQVAETLSFTAAGDRVGLTPSAVSQAITELESALGFPLFERSTRRVALSSSGKEFLPSAQTVLRHATLAERTAADVRARSTGLVRVAAPMVIAAFMLPLAISDWRKKRPDVVVRIHDAPVESLVRIVEEGDVDMAVGPDRATADDLAAQVLFKSPWVAWCAPTSPLARRRKLRWAELRDTALVTAGRDHERSLAPLLQTDIRFERTAPFEVVENISTALGIAATGLALAISPAYVSRLARKLKLVSRPLIEPEAARVISLYRQVRRKLSPAAQDFAEHLITWFKRVGNEGN